MPIYEYKCHVCKHKFDHLHKSILHLDKIRCECGSDDVEKLVSTFSAKMDNPVLDQLRVDCQKKSDDFSIKVKADKAAGKVRSHEPDEKPRKW